MDLILCHTTADFDTLGAAVGLTRLLPGSRIVLTGGCHPAVRDFLALHRDEYALIERRSVTPSQIRSLTIVDTQQRDRLGKAADWLDLPDIPITLYDHHLDSDRDIPTTQVRLEAVGATSTLIVEQLQAQAISLTPVEATALALGIHADTGSLTFDHTTPRDAQALAWLMAQGANQQAIATYVDPGLPAPVQELLAIALQTLQTETVQSQVVAWVLLELPEYMSGLSSLVSRLMDLTASDALILAAQTPSPNETGYRLAVIGRSKIPGTNLANLLTPLGGGGHSRAAAATLRSPNPQAVLNDLITQFKAQIPHPPTAQELMSSPVRTIRPETTILQAQKILLRYGHSGLSVVNDASQLVGVISRRDLDIALHHNFGHAPVTGYMTTNLKTITPETSLPDIEALMVTYDIGRLPVLEQGQLVGIVTRTDVLRQLHRGSRLPQPQDPNGEWALPSLSCLTTPDRVPPAAPLATLRDRLTPALWEVLNTIAQRAEQEGWHLYLVGGAVRDLLLANPAAPLLLSDIDLVVDGFHRSITEAAGVELARALQQEYPDTRLQIHGQFQTAAVLWRHDPTLGSLWIDIATARTEFYPYPAANPEVEASSIRQDLYRRDFTINALAIRLTAPAPGELLDFFGGLLDLQARQIRVLHANSFIEDPTRIYRAVRFAVRLGFEIDPQTEGYIRHAIASGIYERVQDENPRAPALQTRLKSELKYILQASYWQAALTLLANLSALRCLHPKLALDRTLWRQLRLADRLFRVFSPPEVPPWQGLLEVLLAQIPTPDRTRVATNLQLPADSIERLSQLDRLQEQVIQALQQGDRPSQIVQALTPYSTPLLILIAVRGDRLLRQRLWQYLSCWSTLKPPLDGNDLKHLGYKPGKQFKQMLQDLLIARLDGKLGPDSEVQFRSANACPAAAPSPAMQAAARQFLHTHYPQPVS